MGGELAVPRISTVAFIRRIFRTREATSRVLDTPRVNILSCGTVFNLVMIIMEVDSDTWRELVP